MSDHKLLWFDTETTGTNPAENDVIQVAGQVIRNGQVAEEFNFKCQPFNYDTIHPKALEVNRTTVEQLREYDTPQTMYRKLLVIFDRHINKYDKTDKFIACGQNVSFDKEFMNHFFKKNGNDYFFSYIHGASLCTLTMAAMLEVVEGKKIFTPNYKLETLCKCLGVEIEGAHDALADIVATRNVANAILRRMRH